MAITTYAELQTAIADFLNRDDLTESLETFIALSESQMRREIRHWRMETRSISLQPAGEQYMAFPSDWVESIRLHTTAQGTEPVRLVSRAFMADLRSKQNDADTSSTFYACHADGGFELYPTPTDDIEFELLYYKQIPVLSDTNTSNWLLSEAPDVYLYGSLIQTAPYLQEDERIQTWLGLYASGVAMLNQASEKAGHSGSGLRMNLRGLGV